MVDKCPVCDSIDYFIVDNTFSYTYRSGKFPNTVNIAVCEDCGNMFAGDLD